MKKLLFILFATIQISRLNAQCTVAVQSVSENFNANVLPTCWTQHNGFTFSGNEAWATEDNNWTPMLILPKTVNAKGILTFRARMNSAFGPPAVYIGAVSAPGSPASYVNIYNFNVTNATMTSYTVDLSGYAGSYQYIAIRLPSNNGRRLHIDDINYESACVSSSVSAITQNISVQLNSQGNKAILASQVDNGSISTCGTPTLNVVPSSFNCSNIGINTVTLTATDNSGNVSTATASVTVLPAINDEALTASSNAICSGKNATITTASSVAGVRYNLRNDATNAIIVGPVTGTGNSMSFNTGYLTSNTTFNVYAETNPIYYGLDFDGTNDVINTNIIPAATNSLTIEAWVYPRATVYKRIVSCYNGSTSTSGEYILDTYNATNNGRGLRFVVEGAGNTLHQFSTANVLTLNTWNHVAATFENGIMKTYVNGLAVGTSTAPFTSIPACTNSISIGEDPTVATVEYFNGIMDDIRIWNTARTAAEISGNMNNCLIGNETGLKAYFKLQEGSGTTIIDLKNGSIGTMSGMDPATDWVIGKVDCGDAVCSQEMSQTITISVTPNPTVSVVSTESLLCSGQSATLTASGASTYTWNSGANTSDIVITPTTTTSYTVTGSDANNCSNTSIITQSVSVCTGVNQLSSIANAVTIAPNPFQDKVIITVSDMENEVKSVQVYNALGALIYNANTEQQQVEINLNSEKNGIYFVRISIDGQTSIHKVIKH